MLNSLIRGENLSEDSIKNLKKASLSDPICDLILKLFNENYQSAFEALNTLKKNKTTSQSSEYRLLAAYYFIKTCNYSKARDLLSELSLPIEKEHKYLTSALKVTLLLNQKLFDEAQVLLSTQEQDRNFSLKLVYCYLSMNNAQQALNIIKSDKVKFQEPIPYFKIYSMLIKNKFKKLLDLLELQNPEPNSLDDFLALKAFVLIKLEQFSEGCKILGEVLHSNNKFEIAWHLISIAYFHLEMYSDCFWSISKCLLFEPNNPKYLFNLFRLYEKTQNFSTAKGILDKAKKIDANLDLTQGLFFPIFDFAEFGKRKDCFVHKRSSCDEPIFVKPAVRKLKMPKKRIKVEEVRVSGFDPIITLDSLKMGIMQNSATDINSGLLGFVHKNPFNS